MKPFSTRQLTPRGCTTVFYKRHCYVDYICELVTLYIKHKARVHRRRKITTQHFLCFVKEFLWKVEQSFLSPSRLEKKSRKRKSHVFVNY